MINFFSDSRSFASDQKLYLGAGALLYNMGKTTSNDDASTSLMGQFYLPLTLSWRIPLSTQSNLVPNLSYTPLAVKTADLVSKKILSLGLNLTHHSSPVIDLKAGVGLLNYSISGDGGAVTRSNGGSTATFYLPGTNKTSRSLFLDLGITYRWNSTVSIDLDAIAISALSSRRAISSLISVSKGVL